MNEGFDRSYYIHVYRATQLTEEPIEYSMIYQLSMISCLTGTFSVFAYRTEEMRPTWFAIPNNHLKLGVTPDPSLSQVPYDEMWPDDRLWFPLLLEGEYFHGRCDFHREGSDEQPLWILERWWFGKEH